MKVKVIEKVIEEIITLRYSKGYSTNSLVKYLKKKYDLEKTRSYEMIKMAREQIGELHQKVSESVLEDALATLEEMLERAIRDGNDKLALSVQQELNKIQQLHIQRMDITSKGEKIEQPLFPPLNREEE